MLRGRMWLVCRKRAGLFQARRSWGKRVWEVVRYTAAGSSHRGLKCSGASARRSRIELDY